MFTGFTTENTPAIQVWDFSNVGASLNNSISLPDDCAPIQFFKVGSSSTAIKVYLPSSPIDGKIIKFVAANYGSSTQSVNIFASDTRLTGTTNALYSISGGSTLEICYSKINYSFGSSSGLYSSGWLALNLGSVNSASSWGFGVGYGNAVTASYASAIGGVSNSAIGQYCITLGGSNNQSSGSYAANVAGLFNTASGSYSGVLAGANNTANSARSLALGGKYGTTRSIVGNAVFSASEEPISASSGVQQTSILILGVETTNATVTTLKSNTSAAGTTNQVILPPNSAYMFSGMVIANVTGGGNTSGWKFEGVIKQGANAASTALVAAVTPTVIAQDAGAAAWVVAVTADTTNGGIKVAVTGAAATTIRWVCRIETTEVTY